MCSARCVSDDALGVDVTPDGALQRRLWALLVLRRGQVVTPDVAIDVLWPVKAPRDPIAALHNHLFRLRRSLPLEVIESVGDGYRSDPSRIDLDADRLAVAVNDGRPGDHAVVATIDDILARWHGPAYPELDDVDGGRAEAVRLDELRLRAVEVRAEWRLAAGDIDGAVVELGALVTEEPLRERPRALLMTALSRTGRTVEALRVYDDFRRLLGAELGIDPSPALAAQHAGLLGGVGAAGWAAASRLPVPVTSLVGREDLLDDVLAMVEANRLVTLIGPGGVGKTRMLVEVGAHLRAAIPDRAVVMCELAAATEDTAVDAVAAALAIDGRPGMELADRVATVLADTSAVLLLDNCEHLLEPIAGLVEAVLAGCPNVAVLATSRERLRVGGERLCAVPTLAVTADADAPAVELFVERARAVAPGFDPAADELALVTEIVRRLDGLPLAIELAAARLHTLDVGEVAAGLDRRFELLSAGSRTTSRHGSLHAVVSWSYGLLDGALRRTFCDLSVFAGSFAAVDAAAICDVDTTVVTRALDQLVERSLVVRVPERRYLLLETLRAFATEQRADGDGDDTASERHARHHVEWVGAHSGTGADDRRDRRRAPRAAHGAGLAARPPPRGSRRPPPRLAVRLRDPAVAARRLRLVAARHRRRSRRPRPARRDVVGDQWVLRVDGRRRRRVRCARRPVVAPQRAGRRRGAPGGGDDQRQRRPVRGPARRCDHVVPPGVRCRRRHGADCSTSSPRAPSCSPSGMAVTRRQPSGRWRCCTGSVPRPRRTPPTRGSALARRSSPSTSSWPEHASTRAVELAESTGASFVVGVAGASKASIDARLGDPVAAAEDYRRLISHWRRAGMWSTQWTMLRSIAALLARLDQPAAAAELLGAIRSTRAGHRIFGDDELALARLDRQLRATLGDAAYDEALDRGAGLDGDAAIELALGALGPPVTSGAGHR